VSPTIDFNSKNTEVVWQAADGAARAHQGRLELANKPEGGFRAALQLPIDQPSK